MGWALKFYCLGFEQHCLTIVIINKKKEEEKKKKKKKKKKKRKKKKKKKRRKKKKKRKDKKRQEEQEGTKNMKSRSSNSLSEQEQLEGLFVFCLFLFFLALVFGLSRCLNVVEKKETNVLFTLNQCL